jgi:hypothetical protein
MDYTATLISLQSFLRDIRDYYALSNHVEGGRFTINRSMVSYGLKMSPNDLDAFLQKLNEEGQMLPGDGNQLSFSTSFPEGCYA